MFLAILSLSLLRPAVIEFGVLQAYTKTKVQNAFGGMENNVKIIVTKKQKKPFPSINLVRLD